MFKHRWTPIGTIVLTLAIALALGWVVGPGASATGEALEPQVPSEPQVPLEPQVPSEPQTPEEQQAPLGTGFTFQGQLADEGVPAVGPCDFRFSLYDAASSGTQVGSTLPRTDVALTDGRFGVSLDFGASAFVEEARWLEVDVQCAGDADYVSLGRVALTAAPQSLYALDAGRLGGQSASAFATASHNHLGQTWTGTNNPLKIEGSFAYPGYAPLVLSNSAQFGYGLRVETAGYDGVYVDSAGADGINVCATGDRTSCSFSIGNNGLEVGNAQDDGVNVVEAGGAGVYVDSAGTDGFRVCATGDRICNYSSTGNHGLEVGGSEQDGVHIIYADGHGVYMYYPYGDGVHVEYAGGSGLRVNGAGANGVEIWGVTFDGVQVNSAGRDGVRAQANENGVYANTLDANSEWGFNTPDKIYAGTSLVSAGPLTFVARNGDARYLEPGDVVAGIGLAPPLAGGPDPIPLVVRADGTYGTSGVVGVVLSRFVAEEEIQEIETESGVERYTRFTTHSAEGPIGPGEHLLIVVLGVAQVKVDPEAGVQPGQRLTASDLAGHARPLRTETLNGMEVSEGAPVVGVALAAPKPGETTIPVFVTLR